MAVETVLYVQPTSEIGGSEVALQRLVTGLDPDRYRPIVVLPRRGELAPALEASGVAVRILPMQQLRPSLNPVLQGRFATTYAKTVRDLRRLAAAEGAAVIHSNSLYSLYGAGVSPSLPGPRHIWHVREIPQVGRQLRWPLLHLAEHRSARIICVSHAVARQFTTRHAVVVHDGVDVTAFHPGGSGVRIRRDLEIPAEARVVGWVARLDPWKGAETFLDVAQRLSRELPDLHFVLCGGELSGHREYAQKLRVRARDELGKRVHFTEWRYQPPDMPKFMPHSMCCCTLRHHRSHLG